MGRLYDIKAEILDCIDDETGEVRDIERLESLQIERGLMIENLALLYRNFLSDADQYANEKKRFEEREASARRSAEKLKRYLEASLDGEPYKSLRVNITFRRSERLIVSNEKFFIDWLGSNRDDLLTYKPPEINKNAVKDAIRKGEILGGDNAAAEIKEYKNIQIK